MVAFLNGFSGGRVVTLGSGVSRMPVPSRSAHVMSKAALNGFHDCLRYLTFILKEYAILYLVYTERRWSLLA